MGLFELLFGSDDKKKNQDDYGLYTYMNDQLDENQKKEVEQGNYDPFNFEEDEYEDDDYYGEDDK